MATSKNRLNDLSREEIERFKLQAQSKNENKERVCQHCGKLAFMRADQKFCSSKCRAASHFATREGYVLFLEYEVDRLKQLLDKNGIAHG